MKKHIILSLLLALVLAFSAAGTAFATTNAGSDIPGYGSFTGSTIYKSTGLGSVIATTKIQSADSFLHLENKLCWKVDGKYQEVNPLVDSGLPGVTSLTSTFPRYVNITWDPTGARCEHIAVVTFQGIRTEYSFYTYVDC